MERTPGCELLELLRTIPDPRRKTANQRHELVDILVIALCGVICGCEGFVEIARFGECKQAFFQSFLSLPNGIPSHDTFNRVFARLRPDVLQSCLIQWLHAVRQARPEAGPAVIAIDGKTLRRTFGGGLGALHLVSAWATENGLTLGQVAVEAKSNETAAIPELIELLDLHGAIVTLDAAGCQKAIAARIVEKGGDFVLTLKGNQPTAHEAVSAHFLELLERDTSPAGLRRLRTVERGHGRAETRDYYIAPVPQPLRALKEGWAGLRSLGMVIRESVGTDGKATANVRYYLTSLPPKVKQFARAVRSHWEIENGLHWVLDVAFREDDCRLHEGHAAENLALLNRLALSLLKGDGTVKAGIACKRKAAGWDEDYLLKLLTTPPADK